MIGIKRIILLTLLLRILFSFLPSFEIDQTGWRYWSLRIDSVGPSSFYNTNVFTDNPPGFLYVFWLVGHIKNSFSSIFTTTQTFDFLLKLPSNIADILTGLIIYKIVRKKLNVKYATLGFLAYTLNPAIFFNSSIWGQFDGVASLFLILSFFMLFVRKFPEAAAVSFAIAWSIKPQAIALAPILVLIFLVTKPIEKWISSFLSFLVTTLIIYLPFFPLNPFLGIIYINKRMMEIFSCTTCFAFNFWGIFGNWKVDSTSYFGIPIIYWGFILLALSYIPIFFLKPIKKRFQEPFVYLTVALSVFAFFTFMTRMHERYLFPFFAFFITAAILLRSKFLIYFYIFISILSVINLYLPYASYNKDLALTPNIISFLSSNFFFFAILSFSSFVILLIYFIRLFYVKKT